MFANLINKVEVVVVVTAVIESQSLPSSCASNPRAQRAAVARALVASVVAAFGFWSLAAECTTSPCSGLRSHFARDFLVELLADQAGTSNTPRLQNWRQDSEPLKKSGCPKKSRRDSDVLDRRPVKLSSWPLDPGLRIPGAQGFWAFGVKSLGVWGSGFGV